MNEDCEQDGQAPKSSNLTGSGMIADLSETERAMLREFAVQLRRRDVQNPVAREALDRAADELEWAAADPQPSMSPSSSPGPPRRPSETRA